MRAWHKAVLRHVTSEPQTVGDILVVLAGGDAWDDTWWADVANALRDLEQRGHVARRGLTWTLSPEA